MSCKAVRNIPSGIVDEAISLGGIIDGSQNHSSDQ
jgi:hypothetical protein